jgi:hypothetical protein
MALKQTEEMVIDTLKTDTLPLYSGQTCSGLK